MLCPVFPDVLEGNDLENLVDRISPNSAETVWAEPYNDRTNWEAVRSGYQPDSSGYRWFTEVYERGRKDIWSRYAASLYTRLRLKAEREQWLDKLQFLLYEDSIAPDDASAFGKLEGVLLQSAPGPDGRSRNASMALLQGNIRPPT